MELRAIICLFVALFGSVRAYDQDHQIMPHLRQKRDLSSKTLRVVTILAEPYVMLRDPHEAHPNHLSSYEGFIPDMLRRIAERTKIQYEIYRVPDGRYGQRSKDGSWTGMIGEVIKRTVDPNAADGADLAAAPLTITSLREDVVDFINPFQHLGLTIVYKKPYLDTDATGEDTYPIHFEVLKPLAPEVWILLLGIYAGISVLLWLMNKFNPYEWGGRFEMGHATQHQSDSFNLFGAFWFTFTTLQWQGYEMSPRSIGSRILAGFWFMFVTLTIVTYTGSLVNNLFWASTIHNTHPFTAPFTDLEGLLMNPQYTYGCINGGSTYYYLTQRDGRGEEFDIIKNTIQSTEGKANLVMDTLEGLKRAREGRYAFIMESSLAAYYVNKRPCELAMTNKLFGKRAFGMAIRNNTDDDVREALHGAVLEMMEEGDIEYLEDKWFHSGECWNVTKQEKAQVQLSALYLNNPRRVSISMFWGPLVILVIGVIVAICAAVGETLYYKYKGRYQPKNRPGGAQLRLDDDGNM